MRVLMLGWEFPPYISGGLGTACHGLSQALLKKGVEIDFMLPHADVKKRRKSFSIISASGVPIDTHKVDKAMTGLDQLERDHLFKGSNPPRSLYPFSGGYGARLYEEVYWYTCAMETVAKASEFDVIHAHDWLTYPAGITAKALSGKPLFVHVHATEYDRSPKVNPTIFHLEALGMRSADVIFAVSELTRKTIIEKYGIPGEKVIVSYNGITTSNKKVKTPLPGVLKKKWSLFWGGLPTKKGRGISLMPLRKF